MRMYPLILNLMLAIPLGISADTPTAGRWNIVEGPVIEVTPEMARQVNSETPGNRIPWMRETEKYSIKVQGNLSEQLVLSKTVKGSSRYTLYRISYKVQKVQEGIFKENEISFFIERRFPTDPTIKLKELWPFNKDKALIFKLRPGKAKHLIVSIEV